MESMPACWSVVLPVKPVNLAKSRLRGLPDRVREDLVVAMAVDTVAAAVACASVAVVYVVTNDARAAAAVARSGAIVIADEPDAGLNPALAHAATVAELAHPECGVAALAADLPALRSGELAIALDAASQHSRALVPDAERLGTTVLTALAGAPLVPAYGESSRLRHATGGAVELELTGCPGLRRDVDTAEDLSAAARLGVGARTRTVLERASACCEHLAGTDRRV